MLQPKYHWIELKYLGAIQNPRRQLFADVVMLFLNIRRHLLRQLPRAQRELERLYIKIINSSF